MFISGLNASKQVSEFQTNPLEVIYGNIIKKFLQVTDIIMLTSDCDQREAITEEKLDHVCQAKTLTPF